MYLQTNGDKKRIVKFIKDNINELFIIHYKCYNCEDEQVTDIVELEPELIDKIQEGKGLDFRLPCTNCGYHQPTISVESIFGIEI